MKLYFRSFSFFLSLFFIFIGNSMLFAHIGDINTIYEGTAGPYPVRVIIQATRAVPGNATVSVRFLTNEPIEIKNITALPVRYDVSVESERHAPFELHKVEGEDKLYSADVFFMMVGEYRVIISINGSLGSGEASVPYEAKLLYTPYMSPLFAIFVFGSLLLLIILIVIVAGKMVRESTLFPGEEPTEKNIKKARLTYIILPISIILIFVNLGFSAKKQFEVLEKKRFISPSTNAEILKVDDHEVLKLTITDPRWKKTYVQDPLVDGYKPLGNYWTDNLIPDHGKIMHMFLIKNSTPQAFAHLHPIKIDDYSFAVIMPPLPKGDYDLYADIVHENGFSQTLVNQLHVGLVNEGDIKNKLTQDPDDGWRIDTKEAVKKGNESQLQNGLKMVLEQKSPFKQGKDYLLKFTVLDSEGKIIPVQPYIGMTGHIAIQSKDKKNFSHVHPAGTISLSAQQIYTKTNITDQHNQKETNEYVEIPFIFPVKGEYRIWVQVKINDSVQTGVFDVVVD